MQNTKIDNLAINTIRMLSVDMINRAKSGHPGIALGAAPIIHTLFSRALIYNGKDPNWFNRDRFILSAGHGSSMLYSTLHLAGFDISIDDLKNFRQLHSKTPGHPEVFFTPGVDATTGPLGQGIAMGVGMAIAEKFLAAKYNREDLEVVNHSTYVLCGDGCLQEGVAMEACSLAGRLKLNKLVILYDSNDIQLDGPVKMANNESIKQKFEAMGFNYMLVKEGDNVDQINLALIKSLDSTKPTIIEIKTIIGYGAPNQGDCGVHGSPLGDKRDQTAANLGYDLPPFEVDSSVYEFYQKQNKASLDCYNDYQKILEAYKNEYPSEYEEFMKVVNDDFEVDLEKMPHYEMSWNDATRVACKDIVNNLSAQIPSMVGGCADLTKTTNAKGADGNFDDENPTGRNICFGVREHAMGAIVNGLTLHHLRGFGGGFLVFSDYMKPAIRLAALMGIRSQFIFSHDTALVGEDGPTHQPVEQMLMLRSIPNILCFNPGDANETTYAFKVASTYKDKPSVIFTTRSKVRTLEGTSCEGVSRGGYILQKEKGSLDGIIISAGSELELAVDVANELAGEGINVRVVSMPSTNLFDLQDKSYQEEVLPKGVKMMAIEMSHPASWYKYTPNVYGLDHFGLSAPANAVREELGFTVNKVKDYFKNL